MAQSPDDKPDDASLRARLEKLSTSLETHRAPDRTRASGGDRTLGDGMGAGFRVVSELVAGVVVGGGLGWLLDRWFATKPALMLILGGLGLAGGFWNIVRTAMLPPRNKSDG